MDIQRILRMSVVTFAICKIVFCIWVYVHVINLRTRQEEESVVFERYQIKRPETKVCRSSTGEGVH